jgi:hypothetical protein
VIQNQAFELIKETVEGCIQQFIKSDSTGKHVLRHSNSLENQALYLEDYVNFSEAQLRLYEITGNEIFKNNAVDSADFIIKNFIQNGDVFVTAISNSTPGLTNLAAPLYDQSYRSTMATLVHLLMRLSVFKSEFSPLEIFKEKYQEFSQFILSNPIGHGEGLRALTYPSNIFRKIEVPIEWIERQEFVEIRSHFFSRFVLDYHKKKDDSFQICSIDTCEVSAIGFENFRDLFKPKDQ